MTGQSGSFYKIVLLCGGTSSEREVSLASATNVEKALSEAGHEIIKIDTAEPNFLTRIESLQPDVAFIALHGKGGEDGSLQGALEILGIPYTGSGVLGSALAMDKHRSKIMYQNAGFLTAPWVFFTADEKDNKKANPEAIIEELGLPLVVKPVESGSSVGVSIVQRAEDLPGALEEAFSENTGVLIEKYIKGIEVTISVIGAEEPFSLPTIEIIPSNEFYNYESKYAAGGSEHIIPARLDEETLEKAGDIAVQAHKQLNCFGVSRSDTIVDEEKNVWMIETNTIPGMTGTSLLPDSAAHAGISQQELYEMFITWALERARR